MREKEKKREGSLGNDLVGALIEVFQRFLLPSLVLGADLNSPIEEDYVRLSSPRSKTSKLLLSASTPDHQRKYLPV